MARSRIWFGIGPILNPFGVVMARFVVFNLPVLGFLVLWAVGTARG
ncbi:MAG: hypothetical protein U1E73_03410 [Planctomycetota bacterium]